MSAESTCQIVNCLSLPRRLGVISHAYKSPFLPMNRYREYAINDDWIATDILAHTYFSESLWPHRVSSTTQRTETVSPITPCTTISRGRLSLGSDSARYARPSGSGFGSERATR